MHAHIQEYPPAKILLLLRNGIATDWPSLCREFGLDPAHHHTGHYFMRMSLEGLRRAKLVDYGERDDDEDGFPEGPVKGRIGVSKDWERIQTGLGISLSEIAELQPREGMVVKPYFGPSEDPAVKSDIFVLMPFTDSLTPVYQDHMGKVAESLNLDIARADDFFTSKSVMSDIWNAICDARVLIADCTGRNPNVFYEIGLAHVVGKRVVLITQDPDDIPFDIRHLRFIVYDYTPRGMTDFETKLTETIKTELYIFD